MTVTDGYVPTPAPVADYVATLLFDESPTDGDSICYPGAGTGALARAVHRYCAVRGAPVPDGTAIELNDERAKQLREMFTQTASIPFMPPGSRDFLTPTYPPKTKSEDKAVSMNLTVRDGDYLVVPPNQDFDWIIANPPYTRYREIDTDARDHYRERFHTATGQFGLYVPFVEQMLANLTSGGTMAVILPETILHKDSDAKLRRMLRQNSLLQIQLLPEAAFPTVDVETVIVVLERGGTTPAEESFWVSYPPLRITRWLYERLLDETALTVGTLAQDESITSREAAIESAVQRFRNRIQRSQTLLRSNRKRTRGNGGYQGAEDSHIDSTDIERVRRAGSGETDKQESLTSFAVSE